MQRVVVVVNWICFFLANDRSIDHVAFLGKTDLDQFALRQLDQIFVFGFPKAVAFKTKIFKACYGLEYFCSEGDGLWESKDEDLIELAKRELIQIGLSQEGDVVDGTVVRQKKAYPVYDDDYALHVAAIRQELDTRYPNLHLVGRNGMHKYNNQDHAMMTAMLCVENILADAKLYDLWQVNADAEYHEQGDEVSDEKNGSGLRLVPTRVNREPELASET